MSSTKEEIAWSQKNTSLLTYGIINKDVRSSTLFWDSCHVLRLNLSCIQMVWSFRDDCHHIEISIRLVLTYGIFFKLQSLLPRQSARDNKCTTFMIIGHHSSLLAFLNLIISLANYYLLSIIFLIYSWFVVQNALYRYNLDQVFWNVNIEKVAHVSKINKQTVLLSHKSFILIGLT